MSHHSAQILERFRNAVMRPLATFPATRPAVVPGVVTIGPWTSGAHGTTTDANAAARPRSGHSRCLGGTRPEKVLMSAVLETRYASSEGTPRRRVVAIASCLTKCASGLLPTRMDGRSPS